MINKALLCDSIDIIQEGEELVCSEWVTTCNTIHEGIPASLGCGEGNIEIFGCLPKKRQGRDLCVEICPDIDLACFNNDIIIRVYRNKCDIGLYRVHDVIPVKLVSKGVLYSYHMIATQISDNEEE